MKKFIIITILIITTCIIACEKRETNDEPFSSPETTNVTAKTDSAFVAFQQRINELKTEYGLPNQQHISRLSFNKIFKFIVSVVMSDATGAAFGAVVCSSAGGAGAVIGASIGGIGSSILAACNQNRIENVNVLGARRKTRYVQFDNEVLSNLTFKINDATIIDSMGYLHNHALYDISTDNPSLITDSLTYERTDLLDSIAVFLTQRNYTRLTYDLNGINQNVMLHDIKDYIDHALAEDDFSVFPSSGIWRDYDYLFSMISDYANDIIQLSTLNQIYSYTDSYLSIIEESGLRSEDSDALKSGVLVGFASYKLWISYANSQFTSN